MPRVLAISKSEFHDKAWLRSSNYAFAASRAVAPLVGAEFVKAASALPIAFIEQDGRYIPVALLSPLPGRNLFVGPAGQWLGTYVPACLRAYPFLLARPEGSDGLALCVEDESGWIVPASVPGAAPFFEENGTPSPPTQALFDFLRETERSRVLTERAVASLAEARLIEPWPFEVTVDGTATPVTGLYRLDAAALSTMPDSAFLDLRKSGALPLAYLQIASMNQIPQFEHLSRMQVQLAQPTLAESIAGIEELFAQIDPKGQLFG